MLDFPMFSQGWIFQTDLRKRKGWEEGRKRSRKQGRRKEALQADYRNKWDIPEIHRRQGCCTKVTGQICSASPHI